MSAKTPSNPNYFDGYLSAINNAQSLQSVATAAAEKGEYGIATSLCILASEEALKAGFLLIRHHNPALEIPDFVKVFREHNFKHEHIAGLLTLYASFYRQSVLVLKHLEEVEAFGHMPNLPDVIRSDFFSRIEVIKKQVEFTTKNKDISELEIQKALLWWKQANFKKNAGLYVEPMNGKWQTPQSIGKQKYTEADKYTTLIIQYNEFVKNLLDDPDVRALSIEIDISKPASLET